MKALRLVLLGLLLLPVMAHAEAPPVFVRVIPASNDGIASPTQGHFNIPIGLACDAAGNVYVADSGNNRVQKFLPDGTFVRQYGSGVHGSGNNQLAGPTGVDVDSVGNVFIADWGNGRVVKYSQNGTFKKVMNTGVLSAPHDVLLLAGALYVLEQTGGTTVKKYTFASDTTLNIVSWSSYNASFSGNGMYTLSGRKQDSYIVVARGSTAFNAPAVWKVAKSSGAMSSFSSPINNDCNIVAKPCIVTAAEIDSLGNTFTVDQTFDDTAFGGGGGDIYRITKFSNTGLILSRVDSTAYGAGTDPGQLLNPKGVAVSSQGMIFVADDYNRVQVWQYPTPSPTFSKVPAVLISPHNSGSDTLAYKVRVANASGPIPNMTVELRFGAVCDTMLTWCSGQTHPTVSATTDGNGWATFNVSAGGCIQAALTGGWVPVQVWAGSTFLKSPNIVSTDAVNNIQKRILDTGSGTTGRTKTGGVVALSEATYITPFLKTGLYDVCSDLNGDGSVNLGDAIIWTRAIKKGWACP